MRNIVFFGGGNITQAIIKGLIKGGFERNNIFYIDRNNKNQKILSKLKIKTLPKETLLPEEEKISVKIQNIETPFDSPSVVKRTPKLEIAILESSDELSPPTSSSESHTTNQTLNKNFRSSSHPR